MRSTPSLKQGWLPVAYLIAAALLGWLMARWLLPATEDAVQAPPSLSRTDRMPIPAPIPKGIEAVTDPVLPNTAPDFRTSPAERNSLQDLLERQQALSEISPRAAIEERAPQEQVRQQPSPQQQSDQRSLERELRRQAIREMQAIALAEIGQAKAGDTQSLMAALRKFDRNMQAAGAPALIDLTNVEMAMKTAARMQELSAQLSQEAQKGKLIDGTRIKAITDEMANLQERMPRAFIKEDALRKTLQP